MKTGKTFWFFKTLQTDRTHFLQIRHELGFVRFVFKKIGKFDNTPIDYVSFFVNFLPGVLLDDSKVLILSLSKFN
ncbi:hypothetical protein KUTeg_015745 [Tegillarca granosa]|uniref:Uncharacterized protein n=1 Tax=Tegillarca granosa TaxID=220873 RepID=A0ABQ9EP20_TEGGR|nr:hypothetical protein KUTeg_015745 [Tegillarca granosa]